VDIARTCLVNILSDIVDTWRNQRS